MVLGFYKKGVNIYGVFVEIVDDKDDYNVYDNYVDNDDCWILVIISGCVFLWNSWCVFDGYLFD